MKSFEYADCLRSTLKRKGIRKLNKDQLAEIEEIIGSAMQDAWEIAQEYDRGVNFSNALMGVSSHV